MYYVFGFTHRANAATPFYAMSGSDATAKLAAVQAATAAATTAGTHLAATVSLTPNQKSSITIDRWSTQAAYEAYLAANSTVLNAFNTARAAYNAANGITHSEMKVTSSDVLF